MANQEIIGKKTFLMESYGSDFKPGDEVLLTEHYNISNNTTFWRIFHHTGKGVPGNENNHICRYHGWRGTTNDISVHAHGVRKVIAVSEYNAEMVKVTVGRDLHPDWE